MIKSALNVIRNRKRVKKFLKSVGVVAIALNVMNHLMINPIQRW